jgi:glycosyltransferase involved in cell wall biosynthesis
MAAPSLAVIVATFNGEAWIGPQLQSIATQTRAPDELIVTDDGSTDRTIEIVREFSDSARFPVHVMKGPSKGHAENFWSASMTCSSDLISWCDQDDVWLPRKLETSELTLVETGASVVSHSATVTDEGLNSLGRRFPDYHSTGVLESLKGDPWHVMSGFTLLFRRDILARIDWEHRPISHQSGVLMGPDHAVSLVSFASARRAFVSEPLALYRQHSRNLAGAPRALALRDSMRIGLEEYRADAGYARGYLEFLARCGLATSDVVDYYEALIARCDRRADVYEPGRLSSRIRNFEGALLNGVYGSPEKGRFRLAALAKDLTDVLTNRFHSYLK